MFDKNKFFIKKHKPPPHNVNYEKIPLMVLEPSIAWLEHFLYKVLAKRLYSHNPPARAGFIAPRFLAFTEV
jgi:hypothetical protein